MNIVFIVHLLLQTTNKIRELSIIYLVAFGGGGGGGVSWARAHRPVLQTGHQPLFI